VGEDDVAVVLTEMERNLLERLAQAGKPTELQAEDLMLGKTLEHRGLMLFIRDTALAVITPRGRHALTGEEEPKPAKKRPLGFID
jgi:hypothetical protein